MRKLFFIFVIVILSIFIYIWQQNISIWYAYKINNLQIKYDRISSENDYLKSKINSILSLEKMDKIAKEKNFSIPDEKSIIYI
ncbi:MAG: hypothetical protein LBH27_00150 [Endomicrobium sp.]|jgi:cell division protein FtsL|nr:hypothetical protein [Endomicrobium sp.]